MWILILTEESEKWFKAWINCRSESWDEITELATIWCSDNGYNYDNWEYYED